MKALSYLRFLKRTAFKKGMPVQLVFFVTRRCNLRCRHCFYWQEQNTPTKELSINEIEKISQTGFRLLWLSLTGGESFLREDLAAIAQAFCRNGRVQNISIPTNGQLPEKTFFSTRDILKSCPETYTSVSISIDGLSATHNKIRGNNSFQKALETFERLKYLKKEFSNFGLSVQMTCCILNQLELRPLYVFLRDKLKPDNITLNLVRGRVKSPGLKEVDIKYYEDIAQLMKSDGRERKLAYYQFPLSKVALARNFLTYEIVAQIYKNKKFVLPCYAGSLHAVLTEEGNVFPCENFSLKIGNIKEYNYDFKSLWFSPKADKIRKQIKINKCFDTYECALGANILFNLRYYPKIFKELLKL